MVGILGSWERGWNVPMTEAYLWQFPCRDFKVDRWMMQPVSGIVNDILYKEYSDISEGVKDNSTLIPVYVVETGLVCVEDFQHPVDALYIFGNAGPALVVPEGAVSVVVQTPNQLGLMWGHQAMCLILYDRMKKRGM